MDAVLQLPRMRHALAPNWMPRPDSWMWQRVDGTTQGFGATWRDHVGLCNLLWLALDMDKPPTLFDARQHHLYMLLLMYGSPAAGTLVDLVELAEFHPLPVFRQQLALLPDMAVVPRHNLAPLLLLLAERRLYRA